MRMEPTIDTLDGWDPLADGAGADPGMVIAAQRRAISNILRSYTGYYDLFAELLQNALDAVERRFLDGGHEYKPKIWVEIDLQKHTIQVTDNGCGMNLQQLRQFLRPNSSFKSGAITRGSKGVGATYLGYGFNSLSVSTRIDEKTISGRIENGRRWVDDNTGTVPRPLINSKPHEIGAFSHIDQGTAITIHLVGDNIRPSNLAWYQASSAEQWLSLLRIMTPVGGIYIDGTQPPDVDINVSVFDQSGIKTEASRNDPVYLYPHQMISRSASIADFLADQRSKIKNGGDSVALLTELNLFVKEPDLQLLIEKIRKAK